MPRKLLMHTCCAPCSVYCIDSFTTTLLVSPYQKHEEIKKVCEELAELSGLEFVYRNFRIGFREGQAKARAHDGKANTALIKLLAKEFDVPKTSIKIKSGTASRLKTIELPE